MEWTFLDGFVLQTSRYSERGDELNGHLSPVPLWEETEAKEEEATASFTYIIVQRGSNGF